MIECKEAVDNIESILKVEGLDAILIGPYDLSASIGQTGNFNSKEFLSSLKKIEDACKTFSISKGIHVVKPKKEEFNYYKNQGYQFIAYSTDALFLIESSNFPKN